MAAVVGNRYKWHLNDNGTSDGWKAAQISINEMIKSSAKVTRNWLSIGHFQEQAKIAKTGLEMKLITSEMEAETEKWAEAQNAAALAAGGGNGGVGASGNAGAGGTNVSPSALDENNDIVKRARNMSSMAFSMYQFTRGEGTLKTTQDLFTQAEYFAEEANRLYKVVRQFCYQVNPATPPTRFNRLMMSSHAKGSGRSPEEGTVGLRGPNPDVRPAAAVRRQEPDRGQSGHLHQSGQRHPGDQELHERRLQSGDHLFRMRQ